MSEINKNQFLDYAGLQVYDELIKKYIQDNTSNNENIEQINSSISNLQESLLALDTDMQNAESNIEKNSQALEQIKNTLEILNGEEDGSISKAIDNAINSVIDSAPETLDTLKEIADWISANEDDSINLINKIDNNQQAIEQLKQQIAKREDECCQPIDNLSIISLFKVKKSLEENKTIAESINSLTDNDILVLDSDMVINEKLDIPNNAHIDAQGAEFTGEIKIAKNAIIQNAKFTGNVIIE